MPEDIHLTVRRLPLGEYSVEWRLPGGATTLFTAPYAELGLAPQNIPLDAAVRLAAWIWRDPKATPVPPATAPPPRVLLDYDQDDLLECLPWESLASVPLLFGCRIIRWSPAPAALSSTTVALPIRCLSLQMGEALPPELFDLEEALRHILPNPDESLRRAFRITRVTGFPEDLRLLLASRLYSAVHVTVPGLLRTGGLEGLSQTGDARLIAFDIPEVQRDQLWEAYPFAQALSALAHRMIRAGGPGVIVTNLSPAASKQFYSTLYAQLVHDRPLDVAFAAAQSWFIQPPGAFPEFVCRLFLSNGAENLLRLSPIAARLTAEAEDQLLDLQAVLAEEPDLPVEYHRNAQSLQQVVQQTYDFEHESGGLLPLSDTLDAYASASLSTAKIDQRRQSSSGGGEPEIEGAEPRVVNVAFIGSGGVVPANSTLQSAARYNVRVHVGRHLAESIVRNPAEVPEQLLKPFLRAEGLPLRVVISSREFELLDRELILTLPPSGPSEMYRFRVRAPGTPGTAQLRIAIYYETNLLQSIRITASITEAAHFDPEGNTAEVEYCICGTMRDIEMYPPRTLNLLMNGSGDGTHTFAVVGTGIREDLTLMEGEIKASLSAARSTLLDICAVIDKNGKPSYRYDGATNQGTPRQFVDDVKRLAYAGRDLYVDIVTNKDRPFAATLRAALVRKSEIQISSTKSAKYVFPWALVYDKRLVTGPGNEVCSRFVDDLRQGTPLDSQPCLAGSCPNVDDTNVICPAGFWGYRHVLEQPPSIAGDKATPGRDLPMHMDLNGAPRVFMGTSLALAFEDAHYRQLAGIVPYQVTRARAKSDILSGMGKAPSPNLIYFYCHGGKQDGRPFLGVGKDETLLVGDLVGQDLAWQDTHPLVFINGCGTVEISPDDLLTFVGTFVWCDAAGVIGTEILIPESLATEFAVRFFKAMLQPKASVGETIRQERLALLGKYNLLGLAYTPYCHSTLGFQAAPPAPTGS